MPLIATREVGRLLQRTGWSVDNPWINDPILRLLPKTGAPPRKRSGRRPGCAIWCRASVVRWGRTGPAHPKSRTTWAQS